MTPEQQTLQRLAEYNALIEIEGYQRRTQRFQSGTVETNQAAAATRLRRLDELVSLLANDGHPLDIEQSVENWIERHPLTLTGAMMKQVIDKTSGQGNGVSVQIQVGSDSNGRRYPLTADQFTPSNYGQGVLMITLPDSVAEEFRQQGRRQLQREFCSLVGAAKLG